MRSAALIYNPVAGRRRAARTVPTLLADLGACGFAAEALPTRGPGDATTLAREACARGVSTIFALGGDGTVREVARGVLGTGTQLGVLPGGSTNVLARALGLPLEPSAVARRADRLVPVALDVGLCNGEPFLMMASAGLDARVLERQSSPLKKVLGRTGIFLLGVTEWWRYPYPAIRGRVDGRSFEAPFVAVCNLPLYGGPFRLAPEARFDDGLFDLVLFHGRRRDTVLGFAWDLARGRHQEREDVEMLRGRDVRLELARGVSLQVDGDVLPAAGSEVEISFSLEKLSLLAGINGSGAPPGAEDPG